MSSPSDPDEIVSISIERSFLPNFITEPLPNWRSIWETAADRALDLSMEDPSTIRRAVADIGGAPYGEDSLAGQTGDERLGFGCRWEPCTTFVLCSQYVFSKGPVLTLVAQFDFGSGLVCLSDVQ